MKRKKPKPLPRSPDELVAMGDAHARQGELAEAESCFREALAFAPDHLGAVTLLGLLQIDRDKPDAAIELLDRARQAAPGFAPLQLALGAAYSAAGHDELAVAAMETAIKLDVTSTLALERLAKHHVRANRPREAIGMLRRILRRDPAHAPARFLLAGLTSRGDTAAEAAVLSQPADLVADLFNAYAPSFDQHLDGLGYGVPKLLAALVAGTGALPDRSKHVVDLGCGTGLVGAELRAFARTLVGSDLSWRMVAEARRRGVYDELHVEALLTTLARVREVDLVVAADVFIYVGALETTFSACAAALRPGGLFAFSVEDSDGDDVALRPTLRYAHHARYIAGLASTVGFVVERVEPSTIRLDRDQPVQGALYVLRR